MIPTPEELRMMPEDEEKKIYFPPMWILNRAIAILQPQDHRVAIAYQVVLRRLHLRESRATSTVEIIPVEECDKFRPYNEWDKVAQVITLEELEKNYKPTGKTMPAIRAPL